MQAIDIEVVRQVNTWLREGKSVWFCTVVKTYGATYRPLTSLFACSADETIGYLSKDVREDEFSKQLQTEIFTSFPFFYTHKRLMTKSMALSDTPTCGTLELLVEKLEPDEETLAHFTQWLTHIDAKTAYVRKVNTESGKADFLIENITDNETIMHAEKFVQFYYKQVNKMVIIGISPLSMYLAKLAVLAEYQVYVCDNRKELSSAWTFTKALGGVDICWEEPASFVQRHSDLHSAVLALAHSPLIDDPALMAALETNSFYIGAIGSKKNAAKRRERLKEQERVQEKELSRIHGPVGLDIRSKTPIEIAVAIMAEIILERDKQKVSA